VKKLLLGFVLISFILSSVSADMILFAEQYYELYHVHFHQYPEDALENIYYLEQALKSDFANPLYAMARVKDKTEYQRYMNLFRMHVNLKIIEQYLILGSKYDKFEIYFYNIEGPWKNAICASLATAQWAYTTALSFWKEAVKWSKEAFALRNIQLEEIQKWEDENFRIETNDLDYNRIIQGHLKRLGNARNILGCSENK
jgi:hypothetical protein